MLQATGAGPARPAQPAGGLAVAAGAHFFNDALGNVYPVLVPLLMGPLHLGLVVAAVISGAHRLTQNLAQPAFGRLSDGGGRLRAALPAALIVGAVATGLLPLAGTGWLLCALAVAGGVTGGAFHPPAMASVRAISGTRTGRGMALFGMAGNLGRALSPLVLAVLAAWAGPAAVTWLAVPALALGVVYWLTARSSAGPLAAAGGQGPSALALIRGRGRATAAILAMIAAFGAVSNALIILVPVAYRLRGEPVYLGALTVSVAVLAGSLGNGIGGTVSDRVGRSPVIVVAAAASALAMAGFVLTHGTLALAFAALAGLFSMSTNAMSVVMCQDLFPESIAMASGLASGLGSALGTAVVALLAVLAGATSATVALLAAAAIGLLAIPAAGMISR